MTRTVLATRVRKARRASTVGCGHYVLAGQLIVGRRGLWHCLPCALAAIRGERVAMTNPKE